MMPTDEDRRRTAARFFPSVRDDLARLAGAGASGLTRVRAERAAGDLAAEAYEAGKTDALTPVAVADWLEGYAARVRAAGDLTPAQEAAAGELISMMRSRP